MIDSNKQYVTQNGDPVRIYATDGGGTHPVHGAFFKRGEWHACLWTREGGSRSVELHTNLVEVPPQIGAWVLLYKDSNSYWVEARSSRLISDKELVAVKRVTIEEGEGMMRADSTGEAPIGESNV